MCRSKCNVPPSIAMLSWEGCIITSCTKFTLISQIVPKKIVLISGPYICRSMCRKQLSGSKLLLDQVAPKSGFHFLDHICPAKCLVTSCLEVNLSFSRLRQKEVSFFWTLHVRSMWSNQFFRSKLQFQYLAPNSGYHFLDRICADPCVVTSCIQLK